MTVVPGLPSGQQAYMSNVRLQKSPSNSTERGKANGQTLAAPSHPSQPTASTSMGTGITLNKVMMTHTSLGLPRASQPWASHLRC